MKLLETIRELCSSKQNMPKQKKSNMMHYFHLDKKYSLLTSKMLKVIHQFFKLLDVHDDNSLNDLQFFIVMRHFTSLTPKQIYHMFDIVDMDGSGTVEFDEFYILFCIMVAKKDGEMKQFIYRHSRPLFDWLNTDLTGTIPLTSLVSIGFLFGIQSKAFKLILKEFETSGNEYLDYGEFRMFIMACIDKQLEFDAHRRRNSLYRQRLDEY